jgi:hypothetical protein
MQALTLSNYDLDELREPQNNLKLAQLELPKRLGGLGIINLETHRHIASLAGLASAVSDYLKQQCKSNTIGKNHLINLLFIPHTQLLVLNPMKIS